MTLLHDNTDGARLLTSSGMSLGLEFGLYRYRTRGLCLLATAVEFLC